MLGRFCVGKAFILLPIAFPRTSTFRRVTPFSSQDERVERKGNPC